MDISRRDVFKLASASGLVATGLAAKKPIVRPLLAQDLSNTEVMEGEMRYRSLGRTGEKVSLVGLGGHHIGRIKDEQLAIKLTRTAIDRGINFMDNCWDYHDGSSELRMGKALQNGYRDRAFLMTKIDGRTKESAAKQIEQSLQRLRTDRIDLLQHHEIIRLEDPDRIFAPGGSMEAVKDAQKAGKVRYIGFTGHKDPLVHLMNVTNCRTKQLPF